MPSNMPQFTVRVDRLLLAKFRYVAEYNARSANREAEILFRQHVDDFEKQHGEITDSDLANQKG